MKKYSPKVWLPLLLFASALSAQNVGINTTGTTPSANAILDLNSGNSNNLGLIIPSVTLGALLTTFTPPMANAASGADIGMLVYNSVSTNQPIGYYYWNGTTWVSVSGATAWQLTGNAGTNPASNFIGTTDNEDVVFKRNNIESGLLNSSSANTSWGVNALFDNTGTNNTAIGYQALTSNNNTGLSNTAIGSYALYNNTSGSSNTASGNYALYNNTSGGSNPATGNYALYNNTTGYYNTANGNYSLYNNTTGYYNTAAGNYSLYNNTTAISSAALGYYAGYYNTGSGNVFIGDSAGYGNTNGSNNVFLGYKAGPAAPGNNTIYLGNTSTTAIEANTVTSITTWSDRRVKDNIKENVPGLAFITNLKPVTFYYNIHKVDQMLGVKDDGTWAGKYDVEKVIQSGFIAQQVDSAAQACGYSFSGLLKPKTPNGLYALGYAVFVVPLVEAVQEQQKMIDAQKKMIAQQQSTATAQQASIDEMKQELETLKTQVVALTGAGENQTASTKK